MQEEEKNDIILSEMQKEERQIVLMYAAVTLVLSLIAVWSMHLFY